MHYPIINLKKTGKNIYKFCRKKGVTVNEIRMFMNFACSQTIYRWFHGQSLPSLDNFFALSVLLGISIEHILVSDSGMIFLPDREEHLCLCKKRLQIYGKQLIAA